MAGDPLVSVVMSVFNGGPFLEASLQSVLEQRYRHLEVVVVDDGSTDGSTEILAGCADPRVRVLRQANLGLTAALNRALRQAQGEFIARQDADDLSAPERISVQVAYLRDHPELAMVGTWADVVDENGERLGELRFPATPPALATSHADSNQFVHGSIMFRGDALRSAGGYRDVFRYAQDYDLTLRLQERAPVANIPLPLYRLRHLPGKISFRKAAEQAAFAQLARRMARIRRSGQPDPLDAGGNVSDWLEPSGAPVQDYDDVTAYLCLQSGELRKARAALGRLILRRPLDARLYLKWLLCLTHPRVVSLLMETRPDTGTDATGLPAK